MLIEAAHALEGKAATSSYRYIIVDEYQDTSRARYELIRRLRGSPADCQLFLVGDDWQSIYRFAGADVTYFTPGVSIRLHRSGGGWRALQAVLNEIGREAAEDATVLVLARYNFTLEELASLGIDRPQPVQPLTVHRAKGLEADHVVVVDLRCGTHGFPSEVEDDPVLRLLLGEEQRFPNAEERRLFYVALTRARSRVYLLGDANESSPFLQELLGEEYAGWVELFGNESQRYRCPRCLGRTIQRREGPFGAFWGCMHYPSCRGRLPECRTCGVGVLEPMGPMGRADRFRCSSCDDEATACARCRAGALIEREGPHGAFLGCSEWRSDGRGCDYTEPVRVDAPGS